MTLNQVSSSSSSSPYASADTSWCVCLPVYTSYGCWILLELIMLCDLHRMLKGGCLLPVRAKAKITGNKYGATRSAGDYRRKVQLARLCAWGGEDMV